MAFENSHNPIGGYFELEKTSKGGNFPQKDGFFLNTGRNALEYILTSLGQVKKVYIPYYTCEVVLEPLNKLGILYEFYSLNDNLELKEKIILNQGEYLLYTNYFGIKDEYIIKLASIYSDKLIVDCAQALYSIRIQGIKTFYSPRKFVGIPDGAVVFINEGVSTANYETDDSADRMSHLYIRLEQGPQAGYRDFRINAEKLKNQPIRIMSHQSQEMISRIDFDEIKSVRIRNFKYLHNNLKFFNKFKIPKMDTFECPMIYPLWTSDSELKSKLIQNQIFVATYWPNVLDWTRFGMIEYEFANNLLAIPCDQRYRIDDMNRIVELICK